MTTHPETIRRFKTINREKKEVILDKFFAEGCKLCGDKRRPVLQAHHVQPKVFTVSHCFATPRHEKYLIEELARCVSLCANCHLLVHAGLAVVEL